MSKAARSVLAFSISLFGLGTVILIAPDLLLGPFGFPPANDVWIRVAGMLLLILAYYYRMAARRELEPFKRATVHGRLAVPIFLTAFVAFDLAPRTLVLFGLIDAAVAL